MSKTVMAGERVLTGIGVSRLIAIGPAYIIDQVNVPVPEYSVAVGDEEDEVKRFQGAVAKTLKQIGQLRQKTETLAQGEADEVALLLDAYKEMLSGSRLVRGVEALIRKERTNAESAIQKQTDAIAAVFVTMKDPYLAARVADVREVGHRLIRALMQQQYNPFEDMPEGSVLFADEITPADAALMNPERVAGFAAALGGADCHAAIMARTLGLAGVVGVTSLTGSIKRGETVIIDGIKGKIILRPEAATLQDYRLEMQRLAREAKRLKALADVPARTTDGYDVVLHANLQQTSAAEALEVGATGIGLLRTEFLFMNRPTLPSEDEQYESLAKLVRELKGVPLTVRTLDVGGEKLVSALGVDAMESVNPALGLRAIRLGLKQPKLLETQLAAILRASNLGPVRILVPMISSAHQIQRVREHLFIVERRLRRRGVDLPGAIPPLGAMIEIPAAALAADALSKVCDFFSIGSNDLTQYTLAIDRGDDRVADLYNPFHPAVLRLIQFTIAAAWRANIPVEVCGEIAGNPMATELLLGLGLRAFSMAPKRIPRVKENILNISIPQAVAFAETIMTQTREEEIKALIQKGAAAWIEENAPKRKKNKP